MAPSKPTGIIVIDGPDGSGKSTLAQKLVDMYDAHYMHLTYRWRGKMFDYHTAAIHHAGKLSQDRLVVIDRWWMSELCYADAYRGGSNWPLLGRVLSRIGLKYGCIYVYSLPVNIREHLDAFDVLKTQRDELFKDVSPVVIAYHKLWDKVKDWPNVIRYDRFSLDGLAIEDYCDRLVGAVNEFRGLQVQEALDPSNYNISGHLDTAKYLIVGDRTNPKKRHGNWWPFHAYSAGSLHLARTMERLGAQEHEFMYTNYNNSKKETDHLMRNYDLSLIALGSVVFDSLIKDFGGGSRAFKLLNHPQSVVHPAYDLRFRGGKTLACDLGAAILRVEAYGR